MNNVSFGRVIGGSMFCSGTVVCSLCCVCTEGNHPMACPECWSIMPTCCPVTIWEICYSSGSISISIIGCGAHPDVVGGVPGWLQRLQPSVWGSRSLSLPVLGSLLWIDFFFPVLVFKIKWSNRKVLLYLMYVWWWKIITVSVILFFENQENS